MTTLQIAGDVSGSVSLDIPAVAGSNTITFPAETGTLVTTAYTGAALPGQIAWDTTVKTSGFTAVAYGGYFCNTTSAAFTVTLPATPTRGQFVVIVDYAGTSATNNITVARNGSPINGTTVNQVLSTNRQGITFTYIDSTQGWLASSNVYGGSTPFNPDSYSVSYLSVAGGGAGGHSYGGGGGAGGLLTGTVTLNKGTIYTVTVGSGGNSAPSSVGNNGNNSILSGSGITTVTSTGGGGGAASTNNATSGGSGGGASGGNLGTYGTGTPGQGNNGGSGAVNSGGGGGGGAGAVGNNAGSGLGGGGGNGTASSITGSSVYYGGGGGGAGYVSSPAPPGGLGGGGSGTVDGGGSAGSGTANTGGGGGSCHNGGSVAGNGGSGVIILSMLTSKYSGTTTGSPTVTTSGSNTILKYTASGTYTA